MKSIKEQTVQGVVVVHNTPELILNAVSTLRKYHDIPIIIVDGSDRTPLGVECSRIVDGLSRSYRGIDVLRFGRNIGHGVGLNTGITRTTRDNVLIFDSDILVKRAFLHLFPVVGYYAMGQVVYADDRGHNTTRESGIPYVHPHFAIINRYRFFFFPKFRNTGAPLLAAMKEVNLRNPAWLVEVPVGESVTHLCRGTRAVISPAAKYHSAPNLERL